MKPGIILSILAAAIPLSCQSPSDHNGHQHSHEHDTHRPSEVRTVHTDKTELFVEFPALVAGHESRFAAHFTMLEKHRPVTEGRVSVRLAGEGGEVEQTVGSPASPGIFTPTLVPATAGVYRLIFTLETPAYTDEITVDKVIVFATAQGAADSIREVDEPGVGFLKEQAWKMDFQTEQVRMAPVYNRIPCSGRWLIAPGYKSVVVAPAPGRVVLTGNMLLDGKEVKKGELLMHLSGSGLVENNLETELRKARARLDQAGQDYDRKSKLFRDSVIARAEFEVVEREYLVARANYDALSTDYGSSGKEVRAPSGGFVLHLPVENGDFVEEGDVLAVIGQKGPEILELKVAPHIPVSPEMISRVWYRNNDREWISLLEAGGRVISAGRGVDSREPLQTVFVQAPAPLQIPEGSYTEAVLGIGEPALGLAIPESALLESYGSYSVVVQLSGERFEVRSVVLGARDGRTAEVLQGLSPGEWIVTTGAYQVKMAAMSGQAPAHGHAH